MEKRNFYERYEDLSQDSLRYTSIEEAGTEKLIITIDIGDGRKDELIVCEDDDPITLAQEFCIKHSLGQAACKALADQIEQNLELHADDEISTLISVNKSYDTKSRKDHPEATRNSSRLFNDRSGASSKLPCTIIEEKFLNSPETKSLKDNEKISFSQINNYGEKLYMKGLRFIENVKKKKNRISEEQVEKEMKDVTFKPKINANSNNRNIVENILLRKGKEKQEHIERKRGEKLAEELSECTFSPNICKKSERINKSQERKSPNRFLQLYNNAKVSQVKLKQNNEKIAKQECPFVPNTGLTRFSKKSQMSENREKISQSRKAIEEYLSAKNSTKDPKTGQEFFKPVTGRPPVSRRTNSQPIGDYLYSQRSKSSEPQRPVTGKQKLSTLQSEKIMTRIKELRYKQIFEDLKPDEYERITPESIKKTTLTPRTKKILTPLLREMDNLYEKLNYKEFCESMDILMKVLRPDERSIVLKTCKQPQTEEKQIKEEKSFVRLKSEESLYDRNLKKQMWSKEKSELTKKILEQSEMNECTFKPKILKYSANQGASEEPLAFEPFKPLSESYFY